MGTVIKNVKLVLPKGKIIRGTIKWDKGKIVSVSEGEILSSVEDQVIDGMDLYLSPGFIDLHTHGGGGYDFMDGTVEAFLKSAEMHAKHGTTSLLPTTLTSTNEELYLMFEIYKIAKSCNHIGASFVGLHLEGPYFSFNQRGAQDPKYLKKPSPEEYIKILDASDDIVRWSLAPELDGALDMGRELCRRKILPSIAHTDAIYEETIKAYQVGFRHITHLYSGMSTIIRRNAFRYAGVLEAAYILDDMTVEIIADGVHLPKSLLQYVYKFKGPERIALITDSMRGAGMPDGPSILGSVKDGQPVIVEDGVAKLLDRTAFAGSVATADRLVRTMIQVAEVPLTDAVRMMTETPARIIGIDHKKGAISVGMDADLVLFDDNINICMTIVEGNIVYNVL